MKCSCRFDCIQIAFENLFYKYGKFIAKYPWPFLIIPPIISFALLGGMANFKEIADTEYLYTPTNGPAKDERSLMRNLFPENHTYSFSSTRKSNRDGFLQVVITHERSGGNVYTVPYLDAIITMNNNITSVMADSSNGFQDVCGAWRGACVENGLLVILNNSANAINEINITYPLHSGQYFLAFQLGGVVVDENDNIQSAEAIQLSYYVRYQTEEDITIGDLWLQNAGVYVSEYTISGLKLNYHTSLSLNEELEKSVGGIVPRFAITYTVLMTFCVISSIMLDWVRAKVWVALAGELAAGFAIISSLGLLSACGAYFVSVVATMPFLIIGIGIDDLFILLSAWRHTDYRLPASERMGLTMKTAAISITLTSVTDALAFLIGAITTFRSVTLFCAYTGVAVIFAYIYAITFVAAAFALSGRREEANRHEIICRKVLPTAKAGDRSRAYKLCCTGGFIHEDDNSHKEKPADPEKASHHSDNGNEDGIDLPLLTILLRDYIAPVIASIPSRIIIIVLYFTYLAVAIWGCTQMKEGLSLSNLAPDGSYLIGYYDNADKYFRVEHGPPVMFAITETLDYSDANIREDIFNQIDDFRNSSVYHSEDIYYESWLVSFLSYLSSTNQPVPTDMASFINKLKTEFFTISRYEIFSSDVQFNSDETDITASRYLIMAKGAPTAEDERNLMTKSREMASMADFEIEVYQFAFIYTDQYDVILPNTLQNLGIAVASMLVISLILLPSVITVIWVTLSVISIIVGVMGFMVLWNVSLDSVSMINLVMCIGFSVDFSAHISFHFSVSKGRTGKEKLIDSFGHLGTPIVQGALSTILGSIVLATSGTYIFRTFFKLMFLVMVLGFAHAMFVLPTVLSVIGPHLCDYNADVEDASKVENDVKGQINGGFTPSKNNHQNSDIDNIENANNHNSNVYITSGINGPPYVSLVDIRSSDDSSLKY